MILFFKFILGTIVASFSNLVVMRKLRNESIIFPASHCDNCQTRLAWYELIPIFSYLFLQGHCRYCKATIPPVIFISEVTLGLTCILNTKQSWLNYLILGLLFYISIWDLLSYTFPSWVLAPLTLIAVYQTIYSWKMLVIIVFIYFLIQLTNLVFHQFGNGDIDLIGILSIMYSFYTVTKIILVACVLALLFIVLNPNHKFKLPFIPFISLGWILINLITK